MQSRWNRIPFDPRRLPFFYGWVILGASVVGTLSSTPGQTMGMGVFTDYLIEALGLSRLQLANAYAAGTITSAFLLPMAGVMLDRFGCRVGIVFSALGLGLSILAMAYVDHAANWLAPGNTAVAFAVIALSFLASRFFGQGCVTMVSRVLVGKWFDRLRGRASAVSSVFVSFGFMYAPLLLNQITLDYGWRTTCWMLFGFSGIFMAALGALLYRDNPEACGLLPDGGVAAPSTRPPSRHAQAPTREFERREALRTTAFWAVSLALAFHGLMFTAFTFHVTSIGAEIGLDRNNAYAIFILMPWFSVAANVFGGWISDYIKLKWLLVAMMVLEAIATAALPYANTLTGWVLFNAGYGIGGGIFAIMLTLPFPRFFGTRHLGAISGLNMSIMVFASALGPILFSLVNVATGTYQMAIFGMAVPPLLIALLCLRANNPQP